MTDFLFLVLLTENSVFSDFSDFSILTWMFKNNNFKFHTQKVHIRTYMEKNAVTLLYLRSLDISAYIFVTDNWTKVLVAPRQF